MESFSQGRFSFPEQLYLLSRGEVSVVNLEIPCWSPEVNTDLPPRETMLESLIEVFTQGPLRGC